MVLNNTKLQDIVLNNAHPDSPDMDNIRHASVALLIGSKSKDNILGILKAQSPKYPWGNQVALPGGHVDKTDESPLYTAKREVKEELNLDHIDLVGSLGHFMTIKNVCVEAYAGYYDEEEEIDPLESEISRVLKIPMDDLLETHIKKNFTNRQPSIEELLYPVEDVVIWGVTARILHHFLELSLHSYDKNPKIEVPC